jgi:predicted 2-oxoglutarate/Fe(II)-dependent dioxygenase YbiX
LSKSRQPEVNNLSNYSSASDVLITPSFIEPVVCADWIADARRSSAVPAKVTKAKGRIDLEMRRTSRLFVSAEKEQQINRYLQELKPRLEVHFQTGLSGVESFQFLLYREGDFYKRHADKNDRLDMPDYIKARRVSIVIFLNDETSSYTGGTLAVWSLAGPIRVQGETGKVVAFRSELMHEVEPVQAGERYAIVSWYF